jgi:hypothetical protein
MHVRGLAYKRNYLSSLTHKTIEWGMQSYYEVCRARAAAVRTGLTNYITNSVIAFSGLQLYSSLRAVHSVCPKLGPFFSSSWTTDLAMLLSYKINTSVSFLTVFSSDPTGYFEATWVIRRKPNLCISRIRLSFLISSSTAGWSFENKTKLTF